MRAFELLEDARSTAISAEEFLTNKHKIAVALQRVEQNAVIYRGMRGVRQDILYTNPVSAPPRRSANTNNFYTLLMDHLPSWQRYPKRSHSLICTTEPSYARSFGNMYVVLPLGDPLIGIASEYDFWLSFPNLKHNTLLDSLEELNFLLEDATRHYTDEILNETDYHVLVGQLEEVSRRRQESTTRDSRLETLFHPTSDLLENINIWLDPEENDLRSTPLSQFQSIPNREIWFSAPSYLIREGTLHQLMRKLGMTIPPALGGK